MALSDKAAQWREHLIAFCEQYRGAGAADLLARDELELDPLVDEQRRVTGGVLLQFLDFIQGDAAFENFPALEDNPIGDRLFVFATDTAGVAAASDLVEIDSEHVKVVTKQEWRAFLEAPGSNKDESYEHHFEFWSAWHQETEVERDIVEALDDVPGEPWIHEEGFAIAERGGRGSRHLWSWNGEALELIEESITSWVSLPASLDPEEDEP